MATMFVIFTVSAVLHWYALSNETNPPKSWIPSSPASWDNYLFSIVFLALSTWFAIRAHYRGGRLFWILQIILTLGTISLKAGWLNEYTPLTTSIRYTAQSLLWGGATLLCATHGASIFVIRKKVQNHH